MAFFRTVILVSINLNSSCVTIFPNQSHSFCTCKRGSHTAIKSDHFGLRSDITQLLLLTKQEDDEFNSVQRRVTWVDFVPEKVLTGKHFADAWVRNPTVPFRREKEGYLWWQSTLSERIFRNKKGVPLAVNRNIGIILWLNDKNP